MNKKIKSDLMMVLTAMIWGTSFVAQRAGMEHIGPFTFNVLRSFLGGIALIPVIFLIKRLSPADTDKNLQHSSKEVKIQRKKLLFTGGCTCGIVLFIASSLQQFGLLYTTAGKGGFITALYIVIVPIMGKFLGKKIRPVIWISVIISVTGLYLLCIKDGFTIGKGDFLVLLCAFAFAIHILVIDHFSPKVEGVTMSCIQFFICGVLSLPFMFLTEDIDLQNILECWLPVCYAGILSSGVAFTLQIVAQKDAEPAVASLILSLESVFAALAGVLILREQISSRELIGCIIMFVAIILAQLPGKKERL